MIASPEERAPEMHSRSLVVLCLEPECVMTKVDRVVGHIQRQMKHDFSKSFQSYPLVFYTVVLLSTAAMASFSLVSLSFPVGTAGSNVFCPLPVDYKATGSRARGRWLQSFQRNVIETYRVVPVLIIAAPNEELQLATRG